MMHGVWSLYPCHQLERYIKIINGVEGMHLDRLGLAIHNSECVSTIFTIVVDVSQARLCAYPPSHACMRSVPV
jgi:hypothetical protein